jgi:hypothetical protein
VSGGTLMARKKCKTCQGRGRRQTHLPSCTHRGCFDECPCFRELCETCGGTGTRGRHKEAPPCADGLFDDYANYALRRYFYGGFDTAADYVKYGDCFQPIMRVPEETSMAKEWNDGTKEIARLEDMSPNANGELSLMIQADGDVIVTVREGGDPSRLRAPASVEFCLSGTRSPHTREALRKVYDAMVKDELGVPWPEEPATRSPTLTEEQQELEKRLQCEKYPHCNCAAAEVCLQYVEALEAEKKP